MIVEVDGERIEVPDDATVDEIDALSRPAPASPQRPGFGDLQAAEAKREAVATQRNVPAHLLTGYPIDRQRAEAFADAGQTSRPLTGRQAAQGMALLASPFAGPAVGGGLFAAGTSEAESLPEFVQDVGVGGAGGAAGGQVLKLAGRAARPALNWLGGKLGRAAEGAAVRSTNADRTALDRALKGSDEARHALGRFMLDEGLPLRSPQLLKKAAQGIQKRVGPEIGQIAKAADEVGARVDLSGAFSSALKDRRVADLSKNALTRGSLRKHGPHGPPGIRDVMDDWIEQHGGEVTPSVAHDIRQQIDRVSKWDKTAPEQVVSAWRAVREAVDDQLDTAMGSAGLGKEWGAANSKFAAARKLSDPKNRGLADVGTKRRLGNRLGSPSEKGAAVLGAATAAAVDPLTGLAIPAATIAANRYAMPVAARTLDPLARFLTSPASPLQAPAASQAGAATARDLVEYLKQFGFVNRVPVGAAEDDR